MNWRLVIVPNHVVEGTLLHYQQFKLSVNELLGGKAIKRYEQMCSNTFSWHLEDMSCDAVDHTSRHPRLAAARRRWLQETGRDHEDNRVTYLIEVQKPHNEYVLEGVVVAFVQFWDGSVTIW